jgi:hypothetical protein
MSAGSRPTTLADALGVMSLPLAALLAEWRQLDPWQRFVLRRFAPDVARACEQLDEATHRRLDPL